MWIWSRGRPGARGAGSGGGRASLEWVREGVSDVNSSKTTRPAGSWVGRIEEDGGRKAGHTSVVQHDRQDRDPVPLRDPIHAPGHTEQKRPIPHDLTHQPLPARALRRQLDAQSRTAAPAQAAASAVQPAAREGGLDLVGDEDGVGDGFDGEDGVGGDGTADRGGEVGGVVVAVGAGLGEVADEGHAFRVGVGKGGPAVLVSCNGLGTRGVGGEVPMQLLEHGSAIGFPSRFGGDVEDGHLLLQGVDIDVEDPCSFFRPALGRYPGDVAVCHENHVRRRYAIIDAVPQTQTCPMVRREAHIAPSGIKHPQTLDRIRKLHQLSYS